MDKNCFTININSHIYNAAGIINWTKSQFLFSVKFSLI